jgi:quercetin dioxygenase-like cupin family protein
MRKNLFLSALLWLGASTLLGQDPVKVDPKHYKLEFENSQVRVLRITYGPHEKSVMHEHPAGVAVFLTDQNGKFTLADGKSEERNGKAGDARWISAEKHLPENLSEKPFELILVEVKTRRAAAKPATK